MFLERDIEREIYMYRYVHRFIHNSYLLAERCFASCRLKFTLHFTFFSRRCGKMPVSLVGH